MSRILHFESKQAKYISSRVAKRVRVRVFTERAGAFGKHLSQNIENSAVWTVEFLVNRKAKTFNMPTGISVYQKDRIMIR